MELIRPGRKSEVFGITVETVSAVDLVLSLCAAASPRRYEMPETWARRVRKLLAGPSMRDLKLFFAGPMPLGTGILQLIPELTAPRDAASLLEAVRALDSDHVVALLASRRKSDRALLAALRRHAQGKVLAERDDAMLRQHAGSLRSESRRNMWTILAAPEEMKRRYVALLSSHLEGWFTEEYEAVEPFVMQRAKQTRRLIGKIAPKELVERVTGGFTLDAGVTRHVMLIPSYYVTPFVVVAREGKEVVLIYGARPAQGDPGPAPLDAMSIKLLKALADETRLRILRLLAQRPMYAQQLAQALGVSHPTIHHHMTLLRIAGLTRTELGEDGNQTYFVRQEALVDLSDRLKTAFVPEPKGEQGE